MAPMKLIAAIRRDEDDRAFAEVVDDEAQQLQRRLIGPVDVLDDQDDRCQPAQTSEEEEHVLEQTPLAGPVGVTSRRSFVRLLLDRGHQTKQVCSTSAQELVESRR